MNEEESSLESVPTSCPVSEKRFHYRNIMEQDTFKKALNFLTLHETTISDRV